MWASEKPINDLEKLQLGYLMNMFGVRKQTSTLAVHSETGRFPLHFKDLHTRSRSSWFGRVSHILHTL